jgi:ribose 5-phosphate isomerase B
MRIAIASDHAGVAQKTSLVEWLMFNGYEVNDLGPYDETSVDYPDFAELVGKAIQAGSADYGILLCGTGIGMSIAANKLKGIRAANVTNTEFATLAREHNDANVVTLSARFVDVETNIAIVSTFLNTAWLGDRHARRVDKVTLLEQH